MAEGGKKHGKVSPNGADLPEKGQTRDFMARDSAASKNSVERVLYVKAHDPARFDALKELAEKGEDYDNDGGPGRGKGNKEISIHLEWSKVKAMVDAKLAGVKLDPTTLEKFTSSNTVRFFSVSSIRAINFIPSPAGKHRWPRPSLSCPLQ